MYLVDIKELENIDGVYEVLKEKDDYVVKIKDEGVVKEVFKKVSKCKNVYKFLVEDARLDEIFVNIVGEYYE